MGAQQSRGISITPHSTELEPVQQLRVLLSAAQPHGHSAAVPAALRARHAGCMDGGLGGGWEGKIVPAEPSQALCCVLSLQDPGMNISAPADCVPSDPVQFVLLPVVYCLVLCVGLPGNLAALLVFLQHGKVRKAVRIYLINLTMADILFNLTLPLWIPYYLAGGDWLLPEAACRLAGAAYYLATYSSVTFMALISLDRLSAVQRALPLVGHHGALLACGAAWLLGLGCAAPALIAPQTSPARAGATACFEQHTRQQVYAYAMVAFFAVAFMVVLGSYTSIACSLSSATIPSPGSHRQQARAMVLGMLLVFAVCVAPYHLMLAPWVGSRPPTPPCGPPAALDVLHVLSVALLSLNSCLDPLVYCFCIRRFRADLRQTLRAATRCLPLSPSAPHGSAPSGRAISFTST
ncbi:LOW QUALITY PROTEIN: platelet-activating factor receptor-like [Coturnix japonica]|uniref:LOW QUALITY PROTEIN: platelet-activating factor receptor-like n=1 Tax=Coturnix japonica TaxID=93934 RepID=UPI0013A5BEE7|nr:LOW QUALITY PROTEIN: platelet-activating factor receptor-like [Coturnix japonica]